jgi:hypothetical protein
LSLLRRDPPAVAVMTMARDEGPMLRRWVDHYARHVGRGHLLVLDDGSVDGSTEEAGCAVMRLPGLRAPHGFNRARLSLVSKLAGGLLESYDVVVFTDVDEFLVPDPAHHDDLVSFLAARPDDDVLAPVALNVLHHVGTDEPLRPGAPVLGQRRLAQLAPVMCKPSIKRVPRRWGANTHGIRAPYRVDSELAMFHLKFADRDTLRATAQRRHALVHAEQRGGGSSWQFPAEDLDRLLASLTEGVEAADVPELDLGAVDTGALVLRDGEEHRSPKVGQVTSLQQEALVRIPERFHGLV